MDITKLPFTEDVWIYTLTNKYEICLSILILTNSELYNFDLCQCDR